VSNPFYNPTGNPARGSDGLSALLRAEFIAIGAGFDAVPQITTVGAYATVLVQVGNFTYTLPAAAGTLATLANLAPLAPQLNPTLTGLHETAIAMPALNIDCNAATIFTKTITGNSTFTVSNVPASGTSAAFVLELTNGGAFATTWWSGVQWASGLAPVLTASGVDVLGFYTINGGSTWRGLTLALNVH
jgi:hypothetical protein